LTKCLVFACFPVVSALGVLYLEDGNADAFGMRFTTGKKTSLIIGNSRAAQGLIPEEIVKQLPKGDELGLYNYAFAVGYSSYGPVYYQSIKDKVEARTKNGLFIVTVDPWSLVVESEAHEDTIILPEQPTPLADVNNQSYKPNLSYMLNWFEPSYYEIIHRVLRPANERLHRDSGWLELVLPMDSSTVNYRISEKVRQFEEGLHGVRFSNSRLEYLDKTIKYLKNHGQVFLVYLPAHPQIMKYDQMIMPNFNKSMKKLAENNRILYKDYSNQAGEFVYTDGIHLYQSSGRLLSADLGSWINDNIIHK